jgi:predicted RNA-binding protein with RPS1 domain
VLFASGTIFALDGLSVICVSLFCIKSFSFSHLKLSIKDINYKTDGSEQMAIDLVNGFNSLKEQLPIWTKEKLEEINNL